MKKLIVLLLLAGLFATASAQIKRVSLFQPVPSNLFDQDNIGLKALKNGSVFIPRISAGVIANQFTYNKDTKQIDMTSFSKVGLGLSYAHFIPLNDEAYNNYSFNAFVFFPVDESGLSLALTVSALQYINIGLGYDLGNKQVFGLTGITYTF